MRQVKNALERVKREALKHSAALGMAAAFSIFGLVCGSWFGVDETPKALADMEV